MALRRVSEAPRMMHCLWAGVSFQRLINGEQSYRQLPSRCGGTPGPNWMSATGKRKGAQLLDGVELSHQDISFWHRVYFASQHTSRKWELSTAAALGNHCHFPTRHINKSKQTTLLHNLRLQTEYDLNIKHPCKYFRGRRRFGWYWKCFVFFSSEGSEKYKFLFSGPSSHLPSCYGNATTQPFVTALSSHASTHSLPSSVSQWGQCKIKSIIHTTPYLHYSGLSAGSIHTGCNILHIH